MQIKTLGMVIVAYILAIVILLVVLLSGVTRAIPALNSIIGIIFLCVLFSGLLGVPIYCAKVLMTRSKELEQQRVEALIEDEVDKEIVGRIRVRRRTGSFPSHSWIHEMLVITPVKVLVKRIRAETLHIRGSATVDHSYDEFILPISKITKIKLTKFLLTKLSIVTNEREYRWFVQGLIPKRKGVSLSDYEKLLRPVFGDKLLVK